MIRPTKLFTSSLFGAGIALGALAGPVAAQDAAAYLSPEASHCEIFRALSSEVPRHCAAADAGRFGPAQPDMETGLKTRSIRMHGEPKTSATPAAAEAEVAAVEHDSPQAFAMPIRFEFNSFRLTAEAMAVLDRVAGVLNDELMRDKVIQIEGHADATGPEDYNLSLSELRAREVRLYLIEYHGIAADRLPFVGKGETEPYEPNDPYAAKNRRVQFTNLTG